MKVLVVDDSTTMLRILKNTLMRIGIKEENITTAEDGQQAIDAYNTSKFDFIMTDWNMPNVTGLEFVRYVRSKDKDIDIIMVTTEGGKSEVITALKAGVNNYIVKPFTPQVLREKLEPILEGRI
jgi:two-component system chemotaxis response regulator CheY